MDCYIYCALVGWSARPRLEPLQAIGTIRALPRPPSTRLGCHAVYILYICFIGLILVRWELSSRTSLYILYLTLYVLFLVKLFLSCKA